MVTASASKHWLLWTLACCAGESLGIGVAAAIGCLHLAFLGEPQAAWHRVLLVAAMVPAGTIEGLVTGSFRWSVLRKRFARLRARNWLMFTALGAATTWLLGMIPSVCLAPDAAATTAQCQLQMGRTPPVRTGEPADNASMPTGARG